MTKQGMPGWGCLLQEQGCVAGCVLEADREGAGWTTQGRGCSGLAPGNADGGIQAMRDALEVAVASLIDLPHKLCWP